jgi:hypothetical protein
MLLESLDETIAYEKRLHEAAIEAFEARVDQLIGLGAVDRHMAIRWIVDGLELTETDVLYGADYVCYCLGLPYSMAGTFTKAVAELTKKEIA